MAERNTERARSGRAGVVLLAILCLVVGALVGVFLGRQKPGAVATTPDSAAPTLWTCSMHPQVIQDHPGLCPICHMELTPLGASGPSGALAIDPAVVQSMGVRTVRVERATLMHRVRAYGTLMEREPDHRDINLRVRGWVETLFANVDGMLVAKGDPLFTLSSPELVVAVEELIAARKQRDGEAPASQDPGRDARGRPALGTALFGAARTRLVLMGLDEEEVDRLAQLDAAPVVVIFKSPMDGHVVESAVYAGAAVEPGDRVMRIADNRKLWLDVRVPAQDIGRVALGAAVSATVDAYPGEVFAGEVLFVHPHVDMETRTALVRAEIDNADRRLREGQWAAAEITSQAAAETLVVPREVVIDTGERQVAFVVLEGGHFEPREVRTGACGDGGLVEILSGVAAGEEVVASGQFLLDTESRLREAVRKFREAGPAAKAAAPDAPPQPTGPRPAWADGVDALVETYLALVEPMGQLQEADTPMEAQPFAKAARALAARAPGDERVAAVTRSAEPLVGADLKTQRELLKTASAAVIELVSAVPPTERAVKDLFVMWCPMAPGHWLQRHEGVENPYYARTMKACGEVARRVPLAQGGPR